ncbi:hypothetical protein KQX54_014934 [Cotesia glomerata]|uniref:Uncharacterized protein n=1 Tax=Cotesia glomerata TaxID=32391 RepID=A0AAV7IJZ6_COTGL|nr:hypothetical protein KQX54_014934 [Cotesia glomerata]
MEVMTSDRRGPRQLGKGDFSKLELVIYPWLVAPPAETPIGAFGGVSDRRQEGERGGGGGQPGEIAKRQSDRRGGSPPPKM